MRKALLFLLLFFSLSASSAETLYKCKHHQADIEYWQAEYSKVVKENKVLFKELMETKQAKLEEGFKIPDITLGTICYSLPRSGISCYAR